MKYRLLFVLLFGISCISGMAQTTVLMTEKNGYQWYLISKDGKMGAIDIKGNILIPLSYDYVFFHKVNGCVGYFGVLNIDENERKTEGVYDVTGKEIIPCEHSFVAYLGGTFKYREQDTGYIDTHIRLDSKGKAIGSGHLSTSSSSSYSSQSSYRSSSSITNSEYNDPSTFGLKGAVKECDGNLDVIVIEHIAFKRNGEIDYIGTKGFYEITEIERDPQTKLLTKVKLDTGYIFKFYYNSSRQLVKISYTHEIWGSTVTDTDEFIYQNGLIKKTNNDIIYINVKFDNRGNWIHREWETIQSGKIVIKKEDRTITYYQ